MAFPRNHEFAYGLHQLKRLKHNLSSLDRPCLHM